MRSNDAERPDERSAGRESRAERYFERDLKGQQRWYGERASASKRRARLVGLTVIVAGALTAILQTFGGARWVATASAFLGGIVAVAEGWQQIARYAETWMSYRAASEQMKRERRLYVNGAGDYRGIAEEDEAFLRFVEQVEAIVAEEQKIYWSRRGGEASSGAQQKPATPGRASAGQA